LAEQLKDLSLLGLDFSLEVTGFEVGEIDLRIASLDDPPDTTADPADDLPVASGPAVTKPGDLWLLGRHRVRCGNALDIAALAHLDGRGMGRDGVHRPPYNVPIDGHATGLGSIRHRSFAMAAGEMSRPAFAVFLATSLRHLAAFSAGGALLYICIDWRHVGELLAAGREADWFKRFSAKDQPERFERIAQSWDTANKASELSDFSVCTTWGIVGKQLYLLGLFRRRLEYPALKRAVREQRSLYNANVVLIEDKASGTQLIQELIVDGCCGSPATSPNATRSCACTPRLG
jgi:hypothetical protein